jgi:hypothetical protein
MACDRQNVSARLVRHPARARKPFAHAPRTRVICRRRKAKIAKFATQLLQELRGLRQSLDRIEWIE